MSTRYQGDVRIWRPAGLDGVEVLHGSSEPGGFLTRFYLDTYAVFNNPVDDDVRRYRGRTYESGDAMVDVHEPGELACCLRQRGPGVLQGMFLDAARIENAALELGVSGRPHFAPGAVRDASSFGARFRFHGALLDGTSLEQQSGFADALRVVLERHGEQGPPRAREDRPAVARAREYLQAHWNEDVSLHALARACFTSKYHLVRVFKSEIGVPPHTYLRHYRLARATRLLAAGEPISRVAHACGFADQAHLTRTFRSMYTITPGRYRRGAG